MVNCKNNNCFYITNEQCRPIHVNYDYTLIEKGRTFLVFNSNLFYNPNNNQDSSCYYFDTHSNIYYLTVKYLFFLTILILLILKFI
jgi:hypothetical protein